MVRCSMSAQAERGFTLVELVVTMIVVGILAVAVISRFADRSGFDARGLHDGVLSVLRYAQKSAVAQRRRVCVTFGAGSVTLSVASTWGGACDKNLTGPNGVAPYALAAPATSGFAAQPTDFSFPPSGAATLDQVISVKGVPASPINVVATTGYVY